MAKRCVPIWMSNDTYTELKRLSDLTRKDLTGESWNLSRVGIEFIIQRGIHLIKKERGL